MATDETITIHTMKTAAGDKIKYARILRKNGSRIIGQSVSLHRLSLEQRRRAIEIPNNRE
ncbi:MAG: hypothetical protein AB1642_08325 [Pseudomonadota bacterium]